MLQPFAYSDYRKFLAVRINEMPRKGYGQLSALAKYLNVHPTLVSQIFRGQKSLTVDQAVPTAQFLGLGEAATEYFVTMVQWERAGSAATKEFYRRQLERLRSQSQKVVARVSASAQLTEEQRSTFYSDWAYAAVRQATALSKGAKVETIAASLGLPVTRVEAILEFLVGAGLCKRKGQRVTIGPASTHLSADSPFVRMHHSNWRAQALRSLDREPFGALHYTCPLTLSVEDASRVREILLQSIERVNAVVDPSPSEALYCFSFDWFRVDQ